MDIWTLAWDTESGTGASVHATEREAHLALIENYIHDESQEEAIKQYDHDGEDGYDFWQWFNDNHRDYLDTYSIESHKIEIPAPTFNDRELATVLHSLRCLQERREPVENGCIAADDLDPKGNSCCDYFDEASPLNNVEIDALCERLNLAPDDPLDDEPGETCEVCQKQHGVCPQTAGSSDCAAQSITLSPLEVVLLAENAGVDL